MRQRSIAHNEYNPTSIAIATAAAAAAVAANYRPLPCGRLHQPNRNGPGLYTVYERERGFVAIFTVQSFPVSGFTVIGKVCWFILHVET